MLKMLSEFFYLKTSYQTGDRMYKEHNKSKKNKHHVYRAGCAKCKYLPMQKSYSVYILIVWY